MKRMILLSALSIAMAGTVLASDLSTHDVGSLNGRACPPDPDACWSQPGDLSQTAVSSLHLDMGEIIDSEVANDFILEEDSEIVLVRWWSGVW